MPQTWAVLVADRPGKGSLNGSPPDVRQRDMTQLMARAESVTAGARICVLIEARFWSEWRAGAPGIPLHNVWTQTADIAPLEALTRALLAVRARETTATVILIPADHCAAIESAWITAAQGAVRLAAAHHDTVYLLHDNVPAGLAAFQASTDLCSSTVVVGAVDSLIGLCEGSRATKVLDLMTESPVADDDQTAQPHSDPTRAPINLVHVRSVEEYGRIQTGLYTRRASQIDVNA